MIIICTERSWENKKERIIALEGYLAVLANYVHSLVRKFHFMARNLLAKAKINIYCYKSNSTL